MLDRLRSPEGLHHREPVTLHDVLSFTVPVPMLLSPAESGQNLYTVNTVFHWWAEAPPESIGGLDNYHEQSHRCYSNDQKRKCGPVVLEPVFAHAQRSFSIEG
jgi:hypothetical protein